MPYGPETHTGYVSYEAVVEHTPSANRLLITVDPFRVDGTTPSEATRDQIFQAFLNKLAEIPNSTVISAVKKGNFSAAVTSA
jgi:hypothetical protein